MESPAPSPSPSFRRVILPAGEVHVCRACRSELVHPLDWSEVGQGRWRLLLRCPNCEHREEGIFGSDTLESLDTTLDEATRTMIGDLRQLARANIEDEVDRFARALHEGHIWPMDF